MSPAHARDPTDPDDGFPSSPEHYESQSESSEEVDEEVPIFDGEAAISPGTNSERNSGPTARSPRQRPRIDTSHFERKGYARPSESLSPSSTRWYRFDLAVIAALVSPIGNWLTGGDHVKNILFIALLIFYLHQIIEVPWALYQNARSRRHPPYLPPPPSASDASTPEHRYAQAAISELRYIEFFFLFVTVVSPFLGALLLQYATAAVSGPDAISWFSTGLFVLATGMRPWSHLVKRLSHRTSVLHDVIHYPPQPQSEEEGEKEKDDITAKMDELLKRVEALEKRGDKLKQRVGHELDDLFDRFEDSLSKIGRSVRKQERKVEKQERRVRTIHEDLIHLKSSRFSPFSLITRSWRFVRSKIASFGRWLSAYMPSSPSTLPRRKLYPNRQSRYTGNGLYTPPASRAVSSSSAKPDHARDELYPTPGTDIVELEVLSDQEGVGDAGLLSLLLRKISNSLSNAIWGVGHIATAPLRVVLRMVSPQD